MIVLCLRLHGFADSMDSTETKDSMESLDSMADIWLQYVLLVRLNRSDAFYASDAKQLASCICN